MTGRCLFGFSGEKPFLLPDNEGVKMNTSPVRMDDLPLNRFHCRIAALTFGAHLTDGYVLGVIGYAIIQLTPAMQLTPFMAGMIGGSALLGLFLGSLVLGWISDHIGRQKIFTFSFLLITLASFLQFFATTPEHLIGLRILIGIGLGGDYSVGHPTALTNFVQMLAIFLIPTALCFAFGEVMGDRRQGRMLLWAMSVIFVICVGVVMWAEVQGNPHLLALGTDSSINMEGKESRFGVLVSSLFAVVTTAASCGAVIAMHDSFTALGGMVPMWLMQIGEVVFGGVGSGLYGMMLFVLLAVFIAGLMIGRTPEYLGKKIDVREMKLTALAILVTPTLVLMGAALAMMTDAGRSAMLNPGPHGFSEVLYAVSSAANNNGSAFAGLSANSPFWNCLLAFCMFVGRFGVIIPVMAIAGSLVSKKSQAASSGTLPTHGPLFVGLLIGTVLLVGALTFIPALALGPVAEYLS